MIEAQSLRRRLLLWLLLPVLAVSAVNAFVSYSQAQGVASLVYDRWLIDSAVPLAQLVRVQGNSISVDLPDAAIRMLEYDDTDHIYYAVTSPEGKLVAGSRGLPLPPQANAARAGPDLYDGQFEDHPIRLVAIRVGEQGDFAHNRALVIVAETLGKRRALAREILEDFMLRRIALIAVAGVAVWVGVGRGLLPLSALRQQISTRSPRDLRPLPLEESPQEVRPLVQALNALLERLRAALDAQQRFVADAAHQLRTPLAGLKTQAELALRESDMPTVRHSLEQMKTASEQAARVANQLLALARADSGSDHSAHLVRLDLEALARELTMNWIQTALDKGIDLGFGEPSTSAPIEGNAVLLRELISNLIDNALLYTPAGGQVTVAVAIQDAQVALTVTDTGPGIPESERTKVFERFYRVLGTGREGAGLGLAIVREIAELHGAQVRLGAGLHGVGTRVTVVFGAR